MCGSIDAIESTQLAIDSYKCLNKDDIKNIGEHLIIYGLFQALYVQQDSVSNLCDSIDIDFKIKDIETQHPELYEIRQLRNKYFGHPSKDWNKNIHGILVEGISVKLFSYTETGEFSYSECKTSECIEKQNRILIGILHKVIEKIESMEKEHKDKYMHNKLRDCFPADPQYRFEKIFQGIAHIERRSLALSHSEDLIKAVNRFEEEITKRGLQDDDNDICIVRLEIKHSQYPLEKLKEYFSSASNSTLNSQDARAYADSAEKHILDLIELAKNLDDEYMSTD
jgi:hypothetical protein